MRKQIDHLLEMLIIRNDIHLDQSELKLQLSSHPSYPSLHALTGVLDHFKVSNLALQLPAEQEILAQLPKFFIARITIDNVKALVLVERQKDEFKLIHEDKQTAQYSSAAFLESWDGIILAIEKDENIRTTKSSWLTKAHQLALLMLATFALGVLFFALPNVFTQIHLLGSLAGLILSVFIVQHEMGLQSSAVNSFCNISSATSCDAVLTSKGAKLFGKYKLSDLSIVAFSTYLLFWVSFVVSGATNFTIIALLTIVALPITSYALYYQYRVVKKWCPLCLGLVAVLWTQAAALGSIDFANLDWTVLSNSTAIVLAALVVAGAWNLIKPLWERKMELENLEVEHYKFKRNFSVFEPLHRQGKTLIPPLAPIAGEMIFGNRNAPLEIILITNPLCRFCKKMHNDLERLLEQAADQVRVHIRFNVGKLEASNLAERIAMRLLQIYNEAGEAEGRVALHQVFHDDADHDQWLEKNQAPFKADYKEILQQQYNWSMTNGISFTPDLYIIGNQVPFEYRCSDLIYFIDDLIAQQQESNAQRLAQKLLPEDIFREK